MKWKDFLLEFAERPLFHSSMLEIFPDNRHHIQVQLSRWVDSRKISQIRREWYLIEKPFRLKEVPIPAIANSVVHPSYLSLDWALQYYEMIPEYVPNPTSITTGRGIQFAAQDCLFIYHHVQPSFFTGYKRLESDGHLINIAHPEKALLDKIYLFIQGNKYSLDWLKELRLQNLDSFDTNKFESFLLKTKKKALPKAIELTIKYIRGQAL
jgi:predicted transcriptional regulator of viral defense system